MEELRQPTVGCHVIYHDPKGVPSEALVTAVWSNLPTGCLNLVHVSTDESKSDCYGRQIERVTSLCHKETMKVHGFYWRFPEEEPNHYVPPIES